MRFGGRQPDKTRVLKVLVTAVSQVERVDTDGDTLQSQASGVRVIKVLVSHLKTASHRASLGVRRVSCLITLVPVA